MNTVIGMQILSHDLERLEPPTDTACLSGDQQDKGQYRERRRRLWQQWEASLTDRGNSQSFRLRFVAVR